MSAHGGGHDLLESSDTRAYAVRRRWATVSPRRRLLSSVAAGLLVAVVAGWFGVAMLRSSLHARALRDQVTLSATIQVAASSTTPMGGGRVDYYLTVRNLGPRQVRISGLQLGDQRLHVVSRNFAGRLVAPGTTVDIPVSVRLDCVPLGGAGPAPLRGTIAVTPESGRPRVVAADIGQAALITDVADTLCKVRPALRGQELSGLVT